MVESTRTQNNRSKATTNKARFKSEVKWNRNNRAKRNQRGRAARKESRRKTSNSLRGLPNPKTLKNWSQDLSKLPHITYTEIKNYLVYVSCKFYKSEDMRRFKQLKPFKGFKDGYVQDINLSLINDRSGYCSVKSKVIGVSAKTEFTACGSRL